MSTPIEAYWSGHLGVEPELLLEPGVHVVSNVGSGLDGYRGVFFFSRDQTLVVSAPPGVELATERLARGDEGAVLDESALRTVVGDQAGLVIGPAFQGLVEPHFLWPRLEGVNIREALDQALLNELRQACDGADWEVSGVGNATGPWAVATEGSELVGIAGLRARGRNVADVCILTRPDRRRAGMATALVRTLAQRGLADGTLVLYQTLLSNAPALLVAKRAGVEHFATTVAVRLI